MTDDQLEHHCHLASIAVYAIRDPDFLRWIGEDADSSDLHDTRNMLLILSEAFTELAERQGIRPRFRVQAKQAKGEGGGDG